MPGLNEAGPRYQLCTLVRERGFAQHCIEPAGDDVDAARPRVVVRDRDALDQLPQRSRAAVVAGLGAGGQYRLQLFDRAFVALIPWADERAQQN